MELFKILDGIKFKGKVINSEIKSISCNSNKIHKDSLFVAIKGKKFDGNNFIDEAINRGASVIVAKRKPLSNCNVQLIKVNNTRKTMSKLAANFYEHPSKKINIIGITGTNGKTTTCFLINEINNSYGLNTGSIGTLGLGSGSSSKIINTGFTTPESIELHYYLNNLVKEGINNLVMEVSSHALALHRVDDVCIDTGIFTNLSSEHLDFHGNMDNYFSEKIKLFKNLTSKNTAIINLDDKYADEIINKTKAKVLTYGFNQLAYIHPISCKYRYNGMSIRFSINKVEYSINSKLTGTHNVYNIMASILASLINKIPLKHIIKSIEKITCVPGRMEFIGDKYRRVFIDFAHTPDAFQNILSMVNSIKKKNEKIIVVFGCGGDRDKSKRAQMSKISEKYSESIIITSDNPRTEPIESIINDIVIGFSMNKHKIILDRTEAIEYAMSKLNEKSILLIFGKGRENYQIIGEIKYDHDDVKIVKRIINES